MKFWEIKWDNVVWCGISMSWGERKNEISRGRERERVCERQREWARGRERDRERGWHREREREREMRTICSKNWGREIDRNINRWTLLIMPPHPINSYSSFFSVFLFYLIFFLRFAALLQSPETSLKIWKANFRFL